MKDGDRRFALGTFSTGGKPPFPALVVDQSAIALADLAKVAKSKGAILTGTGTLLAFLGNWSSNLDSLLALVNSEAISDKDTSLKRIPLSSLRTHAPIETPRQIICLGANYKRHVVELMAAQVSPETEHLDPEGRRAYATKMMDQRIATGKPYAFTKLVSSVTGPYDPIILPRDVVQPDWELELAVVIGRMTRYVSRADAMSCIAGFTVVNDITARERIYRPDIKAIGTDWLAGKSPPTFLPMGPFLVPALFVSDPMRLQVTLRLNGEIMQDEGTDNMIFDISRQIEYLSHCIQLLPGDVICTGSPAGNGAHFGRYLRDGDIMEGTVSEIGTIRNACVGEK